mmetsp:Transcript_6684/g.21347  ORF Transcript_6684/g.21347 Transcript_6684/m.21347 type:complete len:501 (-) Transcript_6684:75-1577(-)
MQGAGRCLANGFRPSCSCPAPRARSSCRPRAAAGRASPIGSRGGASTTRCATAAQSSRADPSSAAPSPTSSPPWRTAASCRWPSLGRRSGCSAIPSPSGWASSSSRARSSSSSVRRRPPSCTAQQSGNFRRPADRASNRSTRLPLTVETVEMVEMDAPGARRVPVLCRLAHLHRRRVHGLLRGDQRGPRRSAPLRLHRRHPRRLLGHHPLPDWRAVLQRLLRRHFRLARHARGREAGLRVDGGRRRHRRLPPLRPRRSHRVGSQRGRDAAAARVLALLLLLPRLGPLPGRLGSDARLRGLRVREARAHHLVDRLPLLRRRRPLPLRRVGDHAHVEGRAVWSRLYERDQQLCAHGSKLAHARGRDAEGGHRRLHGLRRGLAPRLLLPLRVARTRDWRRAPPNHLFGGVSHHDHKLRRRPLAAAARHGRAPLARRLAVQVPDVADAARRAALPLLHHAPVAKVLHRPSLLHRHALGPRAGGRGGAVGAKGGAGGGVGRRVYV